MSLQVSRVIEDLLEENWLDACTKKENSKIKKISFLGGVRGEIFMVGHLDQKRLILYEFMTTLKRAIHGIVGHSEPKTVNFAQPEFAATIKARWALVANG